MNDRETIPVTALHYQILAAAGLAMIVLGQHWQGGVFPIANVFLGSLGSWMVLFPRPRMPMFFVALVAVVQMLAHHETYGNFREAPAFVQFEPPVLLLAGGLLLFIGSQFRLIAIRWHIAPFDPRINPQQLRDDAGRLVVPQARPESALTPEEIVRFVILAAVCVAFGQWGWGWLIQREAMAGFQTSRFSQLVIVVWLVVIGMFLATGIVGYWRRAHSDPETARMYLQEIAWSEARREFGRIGRWIAWGKRKMKKDVG